MSDEQSLKATRRTNENGLDSVRVSCLRRGLGRLQQGHFWLVCSWRFAIILKPDGVVATTFGTLFGLKLTSYRKYGNLDIECLWQGDYPRLCMKMTLNPDPHKLVAPGSFSHGSEGYAHILEACVCCRLETDAADDLTARRG